MNTKELIDEGIECHCAGRIKDAERLYRNVLAIDPKDFDALHLLGVIALHSGKYSGALDLINQAIAIKPDIAEAHLNRGDAYRALGMLKEAQSSYEAAILKKPQYTEAHNNLGIALAVQGRISAAALSFQNALSCNPDYVGAQLNLGNTYLDLGQFQEAIACYEKAVETDPDNGLAHVMLGRAYQRSGRPADALAKYQEGLALDENLAQGHLLLGHMLHEQGMINDALDCFQHAVDLQPDNVDARWALVMSQLALIHENQDRAEGSRGNFSNALVGLDEWLNDARMRSGADAVGNQQPFYLAYHEINNCELLSRYGDICARLMGAWQRAEGFVPLPAQAHGKIRVGIVSGHVRNHSVWNAIVKGWVREVDRDRFSFHIFHTGLKADSETAFAQSNVARLVQAPKSIREWIDEIAAECLDVLIYPEIGMDGAALKLASMRLAPVQVVTWGHPETSGLPTIDYYLSAEDFEPANAQDNYREKLVTLPHLGCCYDRLPVSDTDLDLDALGIDTRYPLLVCAGVAFKYAPRNDWIFVEIAKRLKHCQFVFFHDMKENLTASLEQRLEAAFEDAGLYFSSYGLFLPWLSRDAFYALMRRADVYLDTIGFSGFNTAMQAVECGLPIVTKDGRFMRGRLTSGILKRLGMADLVTDSDEQYIDRAVTLASDTVYSKQVRQRMEANRHVLFNDLAPIRAFEQFLANVSQRVFICPSST